MKNLASVLISGLFVIGVNVVGSSIAFGDAQEISLPTMQVDGKISVENAMSKRQTYRSFRSVAITQGQLGQFLWAANGNRPGTSRKVIPSAGALYPLEIYAVVGENGVTGLPAGIYNYIPSNHSITKTFDGDKRDDVAAAALNQSWLANAPVIIVISAIYERTTRKYGERGVRYVHMESGAADQNLYLEAVAQGLYAGTIGAFDDASVSEVMHFPSNVKPLLLVGVGK